MWKRATFRSAGEFRSLVTSVGLSADQQVYGAVFYPRSAMLVRLMAPADLVLGRLTTSGAAFLALSAEKPLG